MPGEAEAALVEAGVRLREAATFAKGDPAILVAAGEALVARAERRVAAAAAGAADQGALSCSGLQYAESAFFWDYYERAERCVAAAAAGAAYQGAPSSSKLHHAESAQCSWTATSSEVAFLAMSKFIHCHRKHCVRPVASEESQRSASFLAQVRHSRVASLAWLAQGTLRSCW